MGLSAQPCTTPCTPPTSEARRRRARGRPAFRPVTSEGRDGCGCSKCFEEGDWITQLCRGQGRPAENGLLLRSWCEELQRAACLVPASLWATTSACAEAARNVEHSASLGWTLWLVPSASCSHPRLGTVITHTYALPPMSATCGSQVRLPPKPRTETCIYGHGLHLHPGTFDQRPHHSIPSRLAPQDAHACVLSKHWLAIRLRPKAHPGPRSGPASVHGGRTEGPCWETAGSNLSKASHHLFKIC